MAIKIRCACGNILLAPEDRLGQTGKCPVCSRSITVEWPVSDKQTEEPAEAVEKKDAHAAGAIPRRRSLLSCLSSLLIYLFLAALLLSLSSLHLFSETTLAAWSPEHPWLRQQWEVYREYFLVVRSEQRGYLQRIFSAQEPSSLK